MFFRQLLPSLQSLQFLLPDVVLSLNLCNKKMGLIHTVHIDNVSVHRDVGLVHTSLMVPEGGSLQGIATVPQLLVSFAVLRKLPYIASLLLRVFM